MSGVLDRQVLRHLKQESRTDRYLDPLSSDGKYTASRSEYILALWCAIFVGSVALYQPQFREFGEGVNQRRKRFPSKRHSN